MMLQGWTSAFSNNGTRNGGDQGGIPGIEPIWHIPVDERRFESGARSMHIMANMVMTAEMFYYLGDVKTVAMDLDSRKELWQSEALYKGMDGIALWGDYLLSGWFVHNRHTGEKTADLRDLVGVEDPGCWQFTQVAPDGFLRYIEGKNNDILAYNPVTQEQRYLAVSVQAPIYHEVDNLIIGLRNNTLCAHDYSTGQLRWTRDLPVRDDGELWGDPFGYAGHNDRTCVHMIEDVIECVSNINGSTIWRSDEQMGKGLRLGASYTSGMIDGIYYLMESGIDDRSPAWLTAFDVMTGERLLAKYLDGTNKGFAINGDVMFVIFDGARLAALDRFSGDQIWEASTPMAAAFECITAGNRVIYTSTVNEIRVYEWDTPYVSPHR